MLACLVVLMASRITGCAEASGHGVVPLGFAPADVLASDVGYYVSDPIRGAVHHVGPAGLETVASDLPRAYGLTYDATGALCVSHFTSDDVMTRRSAVSCFEDGTPTELIAGVGQGINGIAATDGGLWLAAWIDTDTASRDGVLAFVRDGTVVRRVEFDSAVPQFVVPLTDGSVWLSVWYEDADGPRNGRILRVSPDGTVEPFGPDNARPAGLAIVGEELWFSDHRDGALVALDREGREVARLARLEEPLGIGITTNSTVCVAEARGHRVSCIRTGATPRR